jgi:hypothetical protein
MLTLTSPTNGGRSGYIVRSRNEAVELFFNYHDFCSALLIVVSRRQKALHRSTLKQNINNHPVPEALKPIAHFPYIAPSSTTAILAISIILFPSDSSSPPFMRMWCV